MSILIHMEMPKDGECIVIQSDGTAYKYNPGDVVMYGDAYNETADAIELPPHGRLIDADAMMAEFEQMQKLNETRGYEFACSFMSSSMEISTEWYCVEDAVNAAPTIIPAEGGADG